MFLIKYYVGGILYKVDCCIVMDIKYDRYGGGLLYEHSQLSVFGGGVGRGCFPWHLLVIIFVMSKAKI